MTIPFDTLRYVEKLKSAGMPEAQAKASAAALSAALEEAVLSTLVTKDDVRVFNERIGRLQRDKMNSFNGMQHTRDLLLLDPKSNRTTECSGIVDLYPPLKSQMKVLKVLMLIAIAGIWYLVGNAYLY